MDGDLPALILVRVLLFKVPVTGNELDTSHYHIEVVGQKAPQGGLIDSGLRVPNGEPLGGGQQSGVDPGGVEDIRIVDDHGLD